MARYTPTADGGSCEFAVTVADQWQRRGLATQLMQPLIGAARAAGYRRMTGSVLSANTAIRSLAQGEPLALIQERGQFQFDLWLGPARRVQQAAVDHYFHHHLQRLHADGHAGLIVHRK